jgi:hypothetical protein
MRTFASIVGALYGCCCLGACGGGGQRATTTPEPAVTDTSGAVTEPEEDPDPPVGTLAPPGADSAPVRAATVSSLPAEGSGFHDDDDWMMHGTPGPRFSDAPLPPVTPQPDAKGCSPDKFVAEGKDKMQIGAYAQSLAAFEKALVCVHDPEIEKYAVLVACKGKLYQRARYHFIRLAERDKATLAQLCQGPQF